MPKKKNQKMRKIEKLNCGHVTNKTLSIIKTKLKTRYILKVKLLLKRLLVLLFFVDVSHFYLMFQILALGLTMDLAIYITKLMDENVIIGFFQYSL